MALKPDLTSFEHILSAEFKRQKFIVEPEPYRLFQSYADGDQSGDLITSVDGHLNVTALARAIVEAIRDAENDALERAADRAQFMSHHAPYEIAQAIRDLKHRP